MNTTECIVLILKTAAAAQLAVAILNLQIVKLLGWEKALAHVPLLLREVFYVHAWFISLMLVIFAAFTWRFSLPMAAGTNPAVTAVALAAGVFWTLRTAMQVCYYSASHWKGQTDRTIIHIVLLVLYGAMSAAYWFVSWRGWSWD